MLSPPLAILLLAAVLQMLTRRPYVQRFLSFSAALVLFFWGLFLIAQVHRHGVQAEMVGNWPPPCGIILVADLLSALMLAITGFLAVSVSIFSWVTIDESREQHGYYPLLSFLLLGVSGAFLTGDLFNLYVWFEIMLMASFVLMVLGGERAQLEGGIKYVTLSLMSSMFLLSSIGLLYHLTGSLNMADLAVRVKEAARPDLVSATSIVLLIAFSIKAAVFPLFFWLPASYHTPPAPVSAIFAGLLTKVGVYALLRVFTLIFTGEDRLAHSIILALSALTMFSGVFGALAQKELRRLLSFHIVSQIGYMILGLGLLTPLALAGTVFYVIHHIIVKTNLFLIAGLIRRLQESYELPRLGGLYAKNAALAVLFLIPALSLAGMPPLSGFWAKFLLVKASFESAHYLLGASALAVSLLTLLSMTKIWTEAFWKDLPPPAHGAAELPAHPLSTGERICFFTPIILLAAGTIVLSFGAGPFFLLVEEAASQLLNPENYITVVLRSRQSCF